MRITKKALWGRWAWSTGLALVVLAVLTGMDLTLKSLSGVDTSDLQGFSTSAQFQAAFWAWSSQVFALRAGFILGLDYLLMPLYAVSFFYSGIIVAERFAPKPGRLRRILLLAAMVPFAGALCDGAENALDLTMLLRGVNDTLALCAFYASNAKTIALTIGGVLLLGALLVRFGPRPRSEAPDVTL